MANQISLGIVKYNGESYLATVSLFDQENNPVESVSPLVERSKAVYQRMVQEMLNSFEQAGLPSNLPGSVQKLDLSGLRFEQDSIPHIVAKTASCWAEFVTALSFPALAESYRPRLDLIKLQDLDFMTLLKGLIKKRESNEALTPQEQLLHQQILGRLSQDENTQQVLKNSWDLVTLNKELENYQAKKLSSEELWNLVLSEQRTFKFSPIDDL